MEEESRREDLSSEEWRDQGCENQEEINPEFHTRKAWRGQVSQAKKKLNGDSVKYRKGKLKRTQKGVK